VFDDTTEQLGVADIDATDDDVAIANMGSDYTTVLLGSRYAHPGRRQS